MRIIKQGKPIKVKETTPISIACQDCGLEAELDRGEDVTRCPCCGSSNLVSTVPFIDFPARNCRPKDFPTNTITLILRGTVTVQFCLNKKRHK